MPEAEDTIEDSEVPATIPCVDPATGDRLGEVPAFSVDEVHACVGRARRAQASWKKTGFAERRRVVRKLLEYVLAYADELCQLVARDAGKTLQNAMLGEIWPVCEKLRWTVAHGERHLRDETVSSGMLLHKRAYIEYQPLGVIGVITPWNYPLQNVVGPTVPALFAGNAVIVKVSEWTAWSAERLQQMFHRVLVDCGHSPDLVQIITGYGDTGAALVSSGVDKVVFTGSKANGRRVIEESAKTLTPVVLELGGKDPMIVCNDADLEQAAHAAAAGVFLTSGQMCLAAERIYVHKQVHDEFVHHAVDVALRLRQGPPLSGKLVDVGAMTMPAQVEIIDRLVQDAVDKGAEVRVGGKKGKGGRFYLPTVLTDVDHTMDITHEETFGPVMCIIKVDSEREAIERANDTDYGLGSYVFTKDPKRARRIASQLVSGSTCVNAFAMNYMAQDLPFGGVRGSGYGRLNGREGLREMTNVKAVIDDRLPVYRAVKVFPGRRGDYEVTRAAIRTVYERGLKNRIKNAIEFGREWLRR
jgi:acyl-CoA reductase-like NAD-dependent aldehyde dehydrogenase